MFACLIERLTVCWCWFVCLWVGLVCCGFGFKKYLRWRGSDDERVLVLIRMRFLFRFNFLCFWDLASGRRHDEGINSLV